LLLSLSLALSPSNHHYQCVLVFVGYGSTVRQADPISRDHEERLWTSGVIGHESSEALLHGGFFFYNCKLLGLRGRDEHHDLDISKFEVGEDDNGKLIQFVGRANKTFKGGSKHRNVDHKNIKHMLLPKTVTEILSVCTLLTLI
jgi:hypothetical protein